MTTIIVRTLDGTNVRYETLLPGTTVAQFKQRISEKQGIAVSDQRLLYGGKYLEDGNTLDSYNIGDVGSYSTHYDSAKLLLLLTTSTNRSHTSLELRRPARHSRAYSVCVSRVQHRSTKEASDSAHSFHQACVGSYDQP